MDKCPSNYEFWAFARTSIMGICPNLQKPGYVTPLPALICKDVFARGRSMIDDWRTDGRTVLAVKAAR